MIENELPGIEEAFIFTHVVFPRRANANYRDSCLMYASYMQIQVARKCFLHSVPSSVTSQVPFQTFSLSSSPPFVLPEIILRFPFVVYSYIVINLSKCTRKKYTCKA